MKYLFALLCISTSLVGCKTPNRMPMADYNPTPATKYAPVSIIVNDGQISSATTYTEYAGNITVVDPSTYCILSRLQQSGLFEYVDVNNPQAETVFLVRFERTFADHIAEVAVKLTGSIVTMYFVPLPYDYNYRMDIDIRHKNDIIASYRYQDNLRDYYFFFEHVFDDHEKMIEVMLSKFYHDLQVDGVLDPYVTRNVSQLNF
jgi:hypothetical protein